MKFKRIKSSVNPFELIESLQHGKIIEVVNKKNNNSDYFKIQNSSLIFWSSSGSYAIMDHEIFRVLGDVTTYHYYIVEEEQWYDNIPEEGVLCEVYNDVSDWKYKLVIYAYDMNSGYLQFIDGNNNGWNYAIPITKDEIIEYEFSGE